MKHRLINMMLIAMMGSLLVDLAIGTKEHYTWLSYTEIREKLATLAEKFPDVILLENAEEKLGIPYLVDCDNKGNKCVLDIVTLTDKAAPAEDKV